MVIFSILQTEKQRLREIKPFAQVIEQVIAEPGAPEPRPRPAKAYPRGHCLPADLPSLPQAPASSCLAPTKAPNPAILPGPAAPFSSRETSSPTSPTSPSIPQTLKTRPALKVSKGDSQFSHRSLQGLGSTQLPKLRAGQAWARAPAYTQYKPLIHHMLIVHLLYAGLRKGQRGVVGREAADTSHGRQKLKGIRVTRAEGFARGQRERL